METIWARAILAVATLLAHAEALVASKRRGLHVRLGYLESLVERLRTENDLLRARLRRLAPRDRPRYAPWERLRILWHRARYGLSLREVGRAFVLHRVGALGSSHSIALIERFWRSLKSECSLVPLLAVLAPRIAERRLAEFVLWFRRHRPHQGLNGRTPEEKLGRAPPRPPLIANADGRWILERAHVAGDRSLPIYGLRRAA